MDFKYTYDSCGVHMFTLRCPSNSVISLKMAAATLSINPLNLYAVLPILKCNCLLDFCHAVIHVCLKLSIFLSVNYHNPHNYLRLKDLSSDYII